jgi:hypothetical protein
MNFLVMLVNAAGIPVVVVGTMGALDVVQKDFREARRVVGLALLWQFFHFHRSCLRFAFPI